MKLKEAEVIVNIGDKEFKGPVSYMEVETVEDVLALLQGDEASVKKLINNINYATGLKARAVVSQQLKNSAAGPDKAIAKIVKDIMAARLAMGKPITEEKAKELAATLAGSLE